MKICTPVTQANGWRMLGFSVLALVALSGVLLAATPYQESSQWGSTNTGQTAYSLTSTPPSLVTIVFAKNPPPSTGGSVELVAGGAPGSSVFGGDYYQSDVTAIAFRVNSNLLLTNSISLVMQSTLSKYREWTCPLNLSGFGVGQWATNQSVFNPTPLGGWDDKAPGSDQDRYDRWTNDIHNVNWVGLRVAQANVFLVQTVRVDHVVLMGPDYVIPSNSLLALADILQARFGVRYVMDLTDAQYRQDADHDGMTDLQELLTGTNPDNPNSVFMAEIVSASDEQVVIRWPALAGYQYTVSRSTDPKSGYGALPDAMGLQATADGFMFYTNSITSGEGPFFYTVLKQ